MEEKSNLSGKERKKPSKQICTHISLLPEHIIESERERATSERRVVCSRRVCVRFLDVFNTLRAPLIYSFQLSLFCDEMDERIGA